MFKISEKQALLDTTSFKIITNTSVSLEVRSRKTRQFWKLQVEAGHITTYHKHSAKCDYHVQCTSINAAVATRKILEHEEWVHHCLIVGRPYH